MIAMQTKALFLDAYRDLNARKLFWVVMILNVGVLAGFATIGVDGPRLSILGWRFPQETPFSLLVYRWIFSFFVVGKWLTWVATILALISTATIFPEFMAGGAIDLYLSKPIGRWRLFLTKYATGLLFVALQVAVFTLGSFLILGWRANLWEVGLFWAIPVVLLFFSYLFSICVFFGILTRSTLTSFSLTLVAWSLIFGINQADGFLMQADDIYHYRSVGAQRQLTDVNRKIAALEKSMATGPATRSVTPPSIFTWMVQPRSNADRLALLKQDRARLEVEASETEAPQWVKNIQPVMFTLNTIVPKTQDTIGLLDRVLFTDTAMKALSASDTPGAPQHGWRATAFKVLHARSMWWIVGSSLVFELVVLGLAGWRFARGDF